MRRSVAPVAVLIGVLATFTAAAIVGMSWHDSARILGVAAIGALIAAPLAAIGFYATRRLSVAVQVAVIACVAVVVSGSALVAAARAMFVSDHDAEVLVVVLLAAATTGVGAALVFARRFGADNQALQLAARRIGAGDFDAAVALERPASAEMTALARELDRTSRRLAAARAHERELDAARRELVAWLSHDLRAPIAGLVAITEALQDGVVTDRETYQRYLATMRSEAARLADLVDQLFQLSLLESGALQPQLEATDIGDLVSDALAAARLVADTKQVHVTTIEHDTLPTIDVEAHGISRILANLLDNAIRHTPSAGTVTIETSPTDTGVEIRVSDECGGIAPNDLEHVFDLAFRADTARTPHATARGGMGLTIARGIARAHGGDIDANNTAAGCCFTLRLPHRPTRNEHPPTRPTDRDRVGSTPH